MEIYQIEPISFVLGTLVGLVCGVAAGFVIWHKRKTIKQAERRLTQLQIISIVLFLLYIASPIIKLPNPDPVIAIGILALVSGEAFGASFARVLEKYRESKNVK